MRQQPNRSLTRRNVLGGALALAFGVPGPRGARAAVESASGIRHSFLAFGAATFLMSEEGEVEWERPENTRDGWLLPNGNFLLVMTRVRDEHGGRVIEVTRAGDVVFQYEGAQSEINTAQRLSNGRTLLTEAGTNPRILEVDGSGKIVFELPIVCQTENIHEQSRMTRKLANGNYLVPLMGEREVREMTPKGDIVWRAKTPHWPFTAIRLANGNSLVTGTQAHAAFEFDGSGKIAWSASNDDLPGEPLNGLCGAQRLPNGNTVITSYQNHAGHVKLNEITRDKKIVWSYTDDRPRGIHHFQILTTNGRPVEGAPLR